MNVSRAVTRLVRPALQKETQIVRQYGNVSGLEKIKQIQKQYQVNDGTPLYLKGGMKDVIMYRLTVLAVSSGTIFSIYKLVLLSYGIK